MGHEPMTSLCVKGSLGLMVLEDSGCDFLGSSLR